ncbi:MAG: hypothetical protein U0R80_18505 [Nocardioidaceae bacterium]
MARLRTATKRTVAACLLASVASGSLALAGSVGVATGVGEPTVDVSGTLLVAPAERAGDPPSYALRTDRGTIVEVTGLSAYDAAAGARFSGRIAVPAGLSMGSARGGRDGQAGTEALLGRAEASHTRMRLLSGSFTRTTAPALAKAGVTHRWFVAAPNNLGSQGMTDADILAQMGVVKTYWANQSSKRIASISLPTSITRYEADATTTGGGCGLTGSDFWAVVQEASVNFPDANFAGTDQLMVLMPTSCVAGGVTGRGTVGQMSFGAGGYSISMTDPRFFEPTLAHEVGHNYGFGHARLGPCGSSCASEYGDLYSPMGGAVLTYLQPSALDTPYRVLQGIADPTEIETVAGGSATTTYTRTLQARGATSGLRSIAIPDTATGKTYYLDYRSGTGTDAGSYYAANGTIGTYRRGVVVEEFNGTNGIALVPESGRNAMVAGETRSFVGGNVSVTVKSTSSSSATLSITVKGLPAYPSPGTIALSQPPVVGQQVSVLFSGWRLPPTNVRYTWNVDGSPYSAGTSSMFTPTSSLTGKSLSVTAVVSYDGYAPVTVTTAARTVGTGALVVATPAAIAPAPVVNATVKCAPPTFTDSLSSLVSTTKWKLDDTVLTGATSPSLTVAPAMVGGSLTCEVTVSAAGFDPITVPSAAAVVAPATLKTSVPKLPSSAKVGTILKVSPGTWTTGTTFTYQWRANGTPVAGATTDSFTPTVAGQKIDVLVTGRLAGYADATVTSTVTAAR